MEHRIKWISSRTRPMSVQPLFQPVKTLRKTKEKTRSDRKRLTKKTHQTQHLGTLGTFKGPERPSTTLKDVKTLKDYNIWKPGFTKGFLSLVTNE